MVRWDDGLAGGRREGQHSNVIVRPRVGPFECYCLLIGWRTPTTERLWSILVQNLEDGKGKKETAAIVLYMQVGTLGTVVTFYQSFGAP